MKTDIHPTYNKEVSVTCACGNSLTTGSTTKAISIEVCSACHPFYTGKQKLVDVAGRVDKFRKRQEEAEVLKQKLHTKQKSKKSSSAKKTESSSEVRISK